MTDDAPPNRVTRVIWGPAEAGGCLPVGGPETGADLPPKDWLP